MKNLSEVLNPSKYQAPNDDAYLAQIEQYQNESWYNRLLENPWLFSKQAQFSPNFFQTLAEQFNDFSSRDRYYADLQANQQQWLSDMLSQMHGQDYDSAADQTARLRVAGLNPDLNGNVAPGEAGQNDQPLSPAPSMGDSSTVQDLSTTALGFLSGILNLGSQFENIKGLINSNVHQEIANNDSAMDFITKLIAGQSTFTIDDINSLSDDDFGNEVLQAASKIDYSPYSYPTRKLIKSLFGKVNSKINGKSNLLVSTLRSRLRKEYAENQSAAVKAASNPLFDENFDEFLRDYSKIVGKAEFDLQKASLKASKAQAESSESEAKYNKSYYDALDPSQRASAENKSYKAEEVTSSQTATIEGMWNEIYQLCKNTHEWYGTLGLVLIPFLRNFGESFATRRFSFGSSSSVSDMYGKGVQSHSGSHSSSFGF